MLCPWRIAHLKHNILQARRLSRWPMNSRHILIWRDSRHIQHKIPNLPPKHVYRVPSQSPRLVLITVDNPKPLHIWRRLKDRGAVGISDELGVVIIDD